MQSRESIVRLIYRELPLVDKDEKILKMIVDEKMQMDEQDFIQWVNSGSRTFKIMPIIKNRYFIIC